MAIIEVQNLKKDYSITVNKEDKGFKKILFPRKEIVHAVKGIKNILGGQQVSQCMTVFPHSFILYQVT